MLSYKRLALRYDRTATTITALVPLFMRRFTMPSMVCSGDFKETATRIRHRRTRHGRRPRLQVPRMPRSARCINLSRPRSTRGWMSSSSPCLQIVISGLALSSAGPWPRHCLPIVPMMALSPNPTVGGNPNTAVCEGRPDPDLSPLGGALTPHWGQVRPFCLPAGDALRPAAPPACSSGAYASAFDEVYVKGSDPSAPAEPPAVPPVAPRTDEETRIGRFYSYDGKGRVEVGRGTPIRLYNQFTRQILAQEPDPPTSVPALHRHARLLASVNLAMADAGIACWEAKYTYDLWRPYQGIRADEDGNDQTNSNPVWLPVGGRTANAQGALVANASPNFPAYPSGHASFGTAMFAMLRKFFGEERKFDFTLISEELPGVVRRFDHEIPLPGGTVRDRYRIAIDENSRSRIFLGVHYNFDATAGIAQGQQVADRIWPHFLRPV